MSLDYVDPSNPPPVEWTGSVLPEPLLYSGAALWFILLIAALIGLLYFRQRLLDERLSRRRAPEAIYHAVRRVLDQALFKTGDETIGAGRKVQDALEQHLGPLLSFSQGLGGPANKLKKALSGKAETHGHDHGRREPAPQPAVLVSAGVEQVVLTPAQIVTGDHHHGEHGHNGEMSARDQRVAVREALEHLSDYWRKDAVERDLAKIQDLLLIRIAVGPRSRDAYRPARRRDAASVVVTTAKPR